MWSAHKAFNVQFYFTICPLTKARDQKKYFFLLLKEGKINSTLSQIAWLETSEKHHQQEIFYINGRKEKKYSVKNMK